MAGTLGNMLGSIDWTKLVSGSDARNIGIGSAIGGALLGRASANSYHDPEDDKSAPVKDALIGALAGGVAGYAIPKGVELFGSAGALAPDDDRLGGPAAAMLYGAGAGTALTGAALVPALATSVVRLGDKAAATRNIARHASFARFNEMRRNPKADRAVLRRLYLQMSAHSDLGENSYGSVLSRLESAVRTSRERGNARAADILSKDIAYLKSKRFTRDFGMRKGIKGLKDIINELPNERIAPAPADAGKLSKIVNYVRRFASGEHYAPKSLSLGNVNFARMLPRHRIALRAGKHALVGAALGLLGHGILGPSAKNNYSN